MQLFALALARSREISRARGARAHLCGSSVVGVTITRSYHAHDHTCRSMRCHAVLPFTFCSATQRHGTEKSNDCRRHELLLCSLWELLQISALTPALVDHCTSNERDDLPPRHCQQCEKLFCRPAKGEEEASAFHYE